LGYYPFFLLRKMLPAERDMMSSTSAACHQISSLKPVAMNAF
jgi:hypothetical protein